MIIKQKGGQLIASGGFGCVFYPSLKCENQDFTDNNTISKLMTTKHAQDEYKQINKYKNILKVIPNYDKYFLLNDSAFSNERVRANSVDVSYNPFLYR